MARKRLKEPTDEELQDAWDIVADYLNKHHQLSFFIDPWSNRGTKNYNLHYLDDNDNKVELVRASRSWKK